MKLFKKINDNKGKITLLAVSMFALSCSDFIDVDKDTDNPTVAPLNLLLTGTQVDLNDVTDFQNFTGTILTVYTHQGTSREEQDQYGTKSTNIPMNNDWNSIYSTLTNIETIINQGTASGDMVYVGIAQMEKAYLMSVAVDLWGDVPYTEAGRLAEGIVSPKFDNQKEIYTSILALIETAKTNMESEEGTQQPGADDLFYGGDMEKWVRFANTFKLKLYNQTRLTTDFDQAGFDALIAANRFFRDSGDDFQFLQTSNLSPTDERNKLYLESYNSTQFGTYQSPWFYEILMGMNPNIHNGNPDPRIPYYFYNQLADGEFPPDQGDASTGDPRADYWDASTGFFSIRFGSVGPNRDFSAENSYTYPGIFATGGLYDDESAVAVNGSSGTGIAPHRILTYDEFLYTQAELMQVGKLSGDVAATLESAITASFEKVDEVVAGNGSTQTIPVLSGSADVTTFIANVMAEFTAGSATKKLEIIMTQKWVGTFGDPFDQYNDYRRTGFPVLANPNGPSPEYQLNNGDGFPLIDSQTVQNNPFQLSFYYTQNELNNNQNAPAQKDPSTYKIFWDN